MELGALIITAFVVGLSGAMLPDPFLTTAIAVSIRRGFWAGPWMVLGLGGTSPIWAFILNAGRLR